MSVHIGPSQSLLAASDQATGSALKLTSVKAGTEADFFHVKEKHDVQLASAAVLGFPLIFLLLLWFWF